MPNNTTDNATGNVTDNTDIHSNLAAMSGCLQGLTVIDLSRNLPGPFASRLLADLGATVIKIEPKNGDPARALGSLFNALNHHKTLEKIDFHSSEGIATIKEHIKHADVMLDSFRPNVLKNMGLDADTLHTINPKLVMVSITGYGVADAKTHTKANEWINKAGHDINFMAMSGALYQLKTAKGTQAMPNVQFADLAGGSDTAVIALLAAVFAAQRTGKGRHIAISMTHSLYQHMIMPKATGDMVKMMTAQQPEPENDFLGGLLPCYRLYQTQDGRYMAVGSLELKFWQGLCDVLELPELKNIHWQLGVLPNDQASIAAAKQLADTFASYPISYWQEKFATADVCTTPVLSLKEAQAHPLFAQQDDHLNITPWQTIQAT